MFLLINLSSFKMLFMIEVIVSMTVITDKILERGSCFKTLHRSFVPSKRQV